MDIDDLYPLVTEAIRRAEIYDDLNAPGAQDAHRDVSLLEERVARLLPASHAEGAIARRGAVRAAISAQDLHRAEMLAEHYCADTEASASLRRELRKMVEEVDHSAVNSRMLAARNYPKAAAQYGIDDIRRVVHEFLNQGAPLPIN